MLNLFSKVFSMLFKPIFDDCENYKRGSLKIILFYIGDMVGFNSTNCWWYASFNIKRRY